MTLQWLNAAASGVFVYVLACWLVSLLYLACVVLSGQMHPRRDISTGVMVTAFVIHVLTAPAWVPVAVHKAWRMVGR